MESVDEHNFKGRLEWFNSLEASEATEDEKFNLKLQLDLASERAELLERQLQDKTHELKQCIEENVDLKRIIEQQSNSIDSLTNQNNELNFILSSVIYVTSFFIFMEKRVTPPLMCFYIYVLCS